MAQDLTAKRQLLAQNAVLAVRQWLGALEALSALAAERAKIADFEDRDFDMPQLSHLTPYILGVLFDSVVPSLLDNYHDPAHNGENEAILLQVK